MLKTIKISLFYLLIIANIACNAQKDIVKYVVSEDVDIEPNYPGGKDALNLYILENIKWTSIDFSGKGYVGIELNIETDGSVSNLIIIKSLDEFLDKEVIKVVSKMPNWIPAYKNNQPFKTAVKFYVYLNIENY